MRIRPFASVLCSFLLALTGCQSSLKVMKDEPSSYQNGFFYQLPEVSYQLQFHGYRTTTQRGKLHDFRHLLKMPLPTAYDRETIVIDSLSLTTTATPDPDKRFFVRTGKEVSKLGQLLTKLPTSPKPVHKTIPVTLQQSSLVIPLMADPDTEDQQQSGSLQQGRSFQSNMNQLLRQNRELVGTVQALSSDSTFQSDSLLRVQLKDIRRSLENYRGRIRELRKLFNTFDEQELGARARELSEIIHKVIELKTGLASGRQDLNYSQARIRAMLNSLDSMIRAYQQPFRSRQDEHRVSWSFSFKPDQNRQSFRLGLIKASNTDQYHMKPYQAEQDYAATVKVNITAPTHESVTTLPTPKDTTQAEKALKGPFYNIPAGARITVSANHRGSVTTIGSVLVQIPQLGTISRLPADALRQDFRLHEFYGSLEPSPKAQ